MMRLSWVRLSPYFSYRMRRGTLFSGRRSRAGSGPLPSPVALCWHPAAAGMVWGLQELLQVLCEDGKVSGEPGVPQHWEYPCGEWTPWGGHGTVGPQTSLCWEASVLIASQRKRVIVSCHQPPNKLQPPAAVCPVPSWVLGVLLGCWAPVLVLVLPPTQGSRAASAQLRAAGRDPTARPGFQHPAPEVTVRAREGEGATCQGRTLGMCQHRGPRGAAPALGSRCWRRQAARLPGSCPCSALSVIYPKAI